MKQTTMRSVSLHFLSVLLGVLAFLDFILAQDQSGFTSIDCGLPENSNYTEKITGINYISDAKFLDTNTSVSKSISPAEMISHQQQLHFVRSFPKGVRNCYRINVTIGTQYLIRATFYYGNYDGLNKPPQFELHFGANVWDTVMFTNASRTKINEIIYIPSQDYMQPCLVNTGKGTPFISSIELRTLNNDSYITHSKESDKLVLSLSKRYDLGSIKNSEYRYKDDVYDRIWFPYESSDWRQLNTSFKNDELDKNGYIVPAIVLSTAVTPVNASAPLQFIWDTDSIFDKYYIYMHYTEVEKLAANEYRSFNITLDGDFWYGPVIPIYRKAQVIFTVVSMTGLKRYLFSFSKTENSTLPPIFNAIEIYKVKDFSQLETQQDDVDAVTIIKNAYGLARNWVGDPCGPVKYMWEGLNCIIDDDNNSSRITSLDLSSSGLTGQIHYSISQLTMLQLLDLSNNSLNGPLPVFLNKLKSLKVLNVGKNKLTGLVPSELLERSKTGSLSLRVDNNPGLRITESSRKNNWSVPLIASLSALNGVILLISLGFWILRRHRVLSTNSKEKSSMKLKHQAFSYTEIVNITNNFKTIIGEGGFGKVYVGVLQNRTQVAVKILSPSSKQGYKEFQSEAQLLMIVHHRNLVSLIGYCDEGEIKALIYEYMVNGNLHQHLLVKNTNILKWNERLNIAVDAARGLDYLHNGCKPPIIHRDLKPANILLDENMDAKISDFGLSRAFGSDADTHISTRPAGTFGYVDPAYQRTGNTNKKNDVYSFGIVLFVLITGRQAIIRTAGENTHILEWVIPIIKGGDIQNVIDSKLEGEFSIDSAHKIVEIAMSCISPIVTERPDISQIFAELKESLSLEMVQQHRERENNVIEWNSGQFQSVTAAFPR